MMHPFEKAVRFLLSHVERHGDSVASVQAARHIAEIDALPIREFEGAAEIPPMAISGSASSVKK